MLKGHDVVLEKSQTQNFYITIFIFTLKNPFTQKIKHVIFLICDIIKMYVKGAFPQ